MSLESSVEVEILFGDSFVFGLLLLGPLFLIVSMEHATLGLTLILNSALLAGYTRSRVVAS